MHNIIIGNKPLNELTAEHLKQIVILEGCCASLDYWDEPIVTDFNNKMFGDTIVIDFYSLRKEDNLKSSIIIFYFDFVKFWWHYTVDYHLFEDSNRGGQNRCSIKVIKYLISEGFDLPLY